MHFELATEMDVTRFCILTSQRSGSTWLRSLLDSPPEIRCFGELFLYRPWSTWPDSRFLPFYEFRQKQRGLRPGITLGYLDGLSHYPGEHQAIGFKLMYNQLATFFPEILYELIRRRYKIIHMVRENQLDVLISQQRRKLTGVAHTTSAEPPVCVHLDVSRLWWQLRLHEAMVLSARAFLRLIPLDVQEITYEQLQSSRDTTLTSISRLLGVQSDKVHYQSDMRKINTSGYRKCIANYEEVNARLCGTRFARLLAGE
jgi:LPS sulfotransferase NodH